ncbi:cysteine hydrolase [Methylorubrum sp. Q1]|uniref:cysteine hydrolase family protein n=1 Tax=Methylorubrum sp. Q1 TaxID=2562453 RepID=UPI0010764A1F|nr:isochorismatase family cysteine hydrolase [Methylorubrum sp. Q1]TFZ61064.1 cysteine hydrolase [Methylorubrum sp. Q1]
MLTHGADMDGGVALAIIDLQNWMFRYQDRSSQIGRLLTSLNGLISTFEGRSLPIYDIVTIHKRDRSTWSKLMLKYDYPCLLEGTPDIEAIEGYLVPPSAQRVVKTQNSAFYGTDFEDRLRAAKIETLMLAGVFIDGCVGLTAADAAQRRFNVICIEDAVGQVDAALRQPLMTWLQQLYEIDVLSAEEAVKRIGQGTPLPPDSTVPSMDPI